MRTTAEEAWAKAADCAARAEEAVDQHTRALFTTLRDSWIQVANNLVLIDKADAKRQAPGPTGS